MARMTLERNVKFKGLVKRLALPRPYVRGLLETMWDVAHECGDPILGDAEDVELAAEWPGEPGAFFEAIKDRWINQNEDGEWIIHDYWHHAPDYVKKRRERELERQNKDLRSKTADNGAEIRTSADNGNTPTPTPTPRKKDKHPSDASTVPHDAAAVATAQPIILTFPTVKGRRDGAIEWHLRQDFLRELESAFDGLDVRAEARKALGWISVHPSRRKTADGMRRFLFGWMTRAQNSGTGQRSASERTSSADPNSFSEFSNGERVVPSDELWEAMASKRRAQA